MPTATLVPRRASGRPLANFHGKTARPVVVCGIADPLAERAVVAFAARLVERLEGRLVLAHVRPEPLLALAPQVAFAARASEPAPSLRVVARRLARLAAEVGIAPTTKVHVGFGNFEERLLATARREDATLILIGSHAAGDPGGTGSPVLRVIQQASCPVVVLPSSAVPPAGAVATDWGQQPIAGAATGSDAASMTSSKGGNVTSSSFVCGVDGSRDARLALRRAAQIAEQLDVPLVVAHVVQPPVSTPGLGPTARQLAGIPTDALLAAGEALVDRVLEEEHLTDAKRRVVFGFPADRLADIADDEGAELLVVGSRGRGAFKAAFLGSVSTDVIGVARCPVLVVPPGVVSFPRRRPSTSPVALGANHPAEAG
jgi:nucleotide-binding universal stress UspA family protein